MLVYAGTVGGGVLGEERGFFTNLILKVWEPGLAQAPFFWCLLQFAVFPTRGCERVGEIGASSSRRTRVQDLTINRFTEKSSGPGMELSDRSS